MQQPVKPEQIELVIEEPKKKPNKQPVKQMNPDELEFKPTRLKCPQCRQTVGDTYLSVVIMNHIII